MTENKAKNEAPNEPGWYWARWRGRDGKIGPWTACHTAELELRNEPELEWWHERLIDPDEAPAFVHRTRDGQPIPVNADVLRSQLAAAEARVRSQIEHAATERRWKEEAWRELDVLRIELRRLPAEMPGCTIVLRKCSVGHSRLVAMNWVDHGCLYCKQADSDRRADQLEADDKDRRRAYSELADGLERERIRADAAERRARFNADAGRTVADHLKASRERIVHALRLAVRMLDDQTADRRSDDWLLNMGHVKGVLHQWDSTDAETLSSTLHKKDGIVTSFDRESGRGVVTVERRHPRSFHATQFHSGLPARFPTVGESVEVVFNEQQAIVEVRAVEAKQPSRAGAMTEQEIRETVLSLAAEQKDPTSSTVLEAFLIAHRATPQGRVRLVILKLIDEGKLSVGQGWRLTVVAPPVAGDELSHCDRAGLHKTGARCERCRYDGT